MRRARRTLASIHADGRFPNHGPALLILLLAGLGFWGCSSTVIGTPPAPVAPAPRPAAPSSSVAGIETRLRAEVASWLGTPYRYGGEDRRGVDCAAFVQQLYRRALGLGVPRTTADQATCGWPVEQSELRTGDLVLFRTRTGKRHVGVYLGAGEFAHATVSRGVTVSRLDAHHWRRAYRGARRMAFPDRWAAEDAPAGGM